MAIDCIDEIPGAAALSDWYGGVPGFHDAYATLQIAGDGTGSVSIRGFRMTSEVDEKGFYVLDKHFTATFILEEILSVSLTEFLPGEVILYSLNVIRKDDVFSVRLDSSYGVQGTIEARQVRIEFQPTM